ncbi:aminoacylase-1B-like isoform X1 [Cherax quadricarinatus]
MMTEQENPAVTNFRNYIKIKTVHPHPDYASCTEYLQKQAKDLEAEFQVVECIPGKPAVIMTLLGEQPDLQSLLLNSHTDVVPVFPDYWKYDPFSAHKDENGDIYGRGTQDMKCVGIQYLEALKRLKKDGHKFLRTIHLTFVPDEELGGRDGMRHLVKMEVFKNMNIGLALDEGYASSTEKMEVFYGQRTPWRVTIECQGQPGHGSQFIPNTVGKKLRHIINSFLGYRDQQEQKLKDNPQLDLGDVTTVNLTYLKGGVLVNVVPAELSVAFDIRICPSEIETFEDRIRGWCKEAGEGVTYTIRDKLMTKEVTCVEDGKNPWWDAFSAACKKENVQLEKKIFPASTDMKYVRQLGINALGFSPMNHTPRLLHDHNEFLNEKIFLRGIDIYYSIILNLANLKPY